MAHDANQNLFVHSGPESVSLAPDIQVKYTLPFEWGTFRVSEDANQFYGFVPLTANQTQGDRTESAESSEHPSLRADIFLVAPNEFGKYIPDEAPHYQGTLALFSYVEMSKRGMSVGFAFDKNTDAMHQVAMGVISEFSDDLREAAEAGAIQSSGVSLEDLMRQDMPQLQLHLMGDALGKIVRDTTVRTLMKKENSAALRQFRFLGAKALGGSALGNSFILAGSQNSSTEALVFNGLWMGYALTDLYRYFRSYIRERPKKDVAIFDRGRALGTTVNNSIHEAYCRVHFDNQAEKQFGDPETS